MPLPATSNLSGGPWHGRTIGDLDLSGQVVEDPLDLSETRVTGKINLSRARLRQGLRAYQARFEGPMVASHCEIQGDAYLSWTEFLGPVDWSWARVQGRLYCWRARFWGKAAFLQMIVEPGAPGGRDYVHPGEMNFSWAWFGGPAMFERCNLEGPVYFWRTRFFDRCSFDETSFGQDATFMGKPSEVCFSRKEIGGELFNRLERCGLIKGDHELTATTVNGEEVYTFGQLANVNSVQELHERMDAAELSESDRTALERQYRMHCGPMFASEASLQRLRICKRRQVKFIAVNAPEWALSGTDVDAIAFFNADQEAVPTAVGLGHLYDRTFLSYGGPDIAIARQFNRALLNSGVETYFYPERALPGQLIADEMRKSVAGSDRVLLLCSRQAADRPGWLFELRQALDREQKEGEGRVLLVLAIDDGLWMPWKPEVEPLRQELLRRNVADFREAMEDPARFSQVLDRLLRALRQQAPVA